MVRTFGWVVLAGVGIGLGSGAATAGPIQWEYNATLQSTSEGEFAVMDRIFTHSTLHVEWTGSLAGASGSGWGWQTVPVGTVTPDGGVTPDWFSSRGISPEFQLTLAIKDKVSGEAGTLTFTGRAFEDIVFADERQEQPISRHAFIVELNPTGEQELTLGGNDYHVQLVGQGRPDGIAELDAVVKAGNGPATPEPGTLALAGLGLGAVGFRLRRFIRIR